MLPTYRTAGVLDKRISKAIHLLGKWSHGKVWRKQEGIRLGQSLCRFSRIARDPRRRYVPHREND